MNKPELSVIIPTYNEEKYVGKLLEDLTKQPIQNFEVIVVDSSTDKTKDVVLSFGDRLNLRYHRVTGKRGLAIQRNIGGKMAKADRLAFLDADGHLYRYSLKRLFTCLKKSTGSGKLDISKEADMITAPVLLETRIPIDGVIALIYYLYYCVYTIMAPFENGGFFYVKKRLYEKTGRFDEEFKHAEDVEYSKRLRKAGAKVYRNFVPLVETSARKFDQHGRLKLYWLFLRNMFVVMLPTDWIKNVYYGYELGGDEK